MCLYYKMPNTTSKSNTSSKRKRSISPRTVAPSPAFSDISDISKDFLDDPKNLPIATDLKTMRDEVIGFKPYKVKKMYADFRNNKSKKGGKKYKRKTMKKKKPRKPTMK